MKNIKLLLTGLLQWPKRNCSLANSLPWHREIINRVKPFSMGSTERLLATINAIEYVVSNEIPGAFVECGVWRGGHMMAAALTLQHLDAKRPLYLFDTFDGMTEPEDIDKDYSGSPAKTEFFLRKGKSGESQWCAASESEVRRNMQATGYPDHLTFLIKGPVEATLPDNAPSQIALLRLDTDWHASTLHELCCLYPRVSHLGVVTIDDYGHWQGAQRAVDEYIAANKIPCLLHRVDYTAREFVKTST